MFSACAVLFVSPVAVTKQRRKKHIFLLQIAGAFREVHEGVKQQIINQ
jgi:hypothetical protein